VATTHRTSRPYVGALRRARQESLMPSKLTQLVLAATVGAAE
jgi:hypothetical protein